MCEPFKIKDGKCNSCAEQVDDNEVMTCFRCKVHFHAVCQGSNAICNKSLLSLWQQRSTKRNFTWYCDSCLTQLEMDDTVTQAPVLQKVTDLEDKIGLLNAKVSSISELLTANPLQQSSGPTIVSSTSNNHGNSNNIWQNTSKVMIMKNNLGAVDLKQLEQRVIGAQIQVTNSRRNTNGDVVITCPTSSAAKKIKDIATEVLPGHTIKDPLVKFSWINVVGFESNHSIDTVFDLLVKNNMFFEFLKDKDPSDVTDYLEVKVVKPCLKNPTIYRALIKVSTALRQVIKRGKDKLRIGLYSCRVYDQAPQIKRCNKCQRFGHWVSDCKPENGVACAKCGSLQHESINCNNPSLKNCVNCERAGISNLHPPHCADSSACPCFSNFRKSHYVSPNSNTNMASNNQCFMASAPPTGYTATGYTAPPTGFHAPFVYHGNVSSGHASTSGAQLQQSMYPQMLPSHSQVARTQQGNSTQQQYIQDNYVAAPLNGRMPTAGHM